MDKLKSKPTKLSIKDATFNEALASTGKHSESKLELPVREEMPEI